MRSVRLDSSLQLPLETFHHTVGLWVKGCDAVAGSADEMQKFTSQVGLELHSSVCDDCSWSSKAGHPLGEESQGGDLGDGVGDGNSLCPPGETVDAGKQVCVAS